MPDDSHRGAAGDKAWRDQGFLRAELATLELSMKATPEQRLEWLEEAIQFAWAAGAIQPRPIPPGWEDLDPVDDDPGSTS